MFDQIRPKLRPSLRYTVQSFGGEPSFILEDSLREQFWRIGPPEFRLISHCDGSRTVNDILQRDATSAGEIGLTNQEAETVISWGIREGLFENMSGTPQVPAAMRWLKRVNAAAFYRLSLGNPQPILRSLYSCFGFLTSPWLLIAWVAMLLSAIAVVIPRWSEFTEAGFHVVTPERWWQYFLVWWGLKAIHELSHGLTCLRYGGNVSEAGVLFLLFAPLGAYVDVTSSWRFTSKWKRIHVTAAGMIIEIFVAAIAVHVWANSSDPLIRQLCLQTILLATVATVFFNGNPLIRFDGYYLLSDLLELPNLYQRGQLATRSFAQRLFLGVHAAHRTTDPYRYGFVFLFGIASAIWRVVLGVGIILGAATLFNDSGLLLALILAAGWFVYPALRLIANLIKALPKHPLQVVRACTLAGMMMAGAYYAATCIRIPQQIVAPGTVSPVQKTLVRAGVGGYVEEVFVDPGQEVSRGDVLLRIDNPELELELVELEQELQRHKLRSLRLIKEERSGELIAEQKVAIELREQLRNRKEKAENLIVVAEQSGVIADFDLQHLYGKILRRGDALMTIADTSELEFRFSMDQSENDRLGNTSQPTGAVVYLPSHANHQVDPKRLEVFPSANWDLDSPALAATQGGPIAVQEVRGDNETMNLKTLAPRISGAIPLPNDTQITPGTIGKLSISLSRRTISETFGPWVNTKVRDVMSKLRLDEWYQAITRLSV